VLRVWQALVVIEQLWVHNWFRAGSTASPPHCTGRRADSRLGGIHSLGGGRVAFQVPSPALRLAPPFVPGGLSESNKYCVLRPLRICWFHLFDGVHLGYPLVGTVAALEFMCRRPYKLWATYIATSLERWAGGCLGGSAADRVRVLTTRANSAEAKSTSEC